MPFPIRNLTTEDERTAFIEALCRAFGDEFKPEFVQRSRNRVAIERLVAAFDRNSIIGTAYSIPSRVTMPGRIDAGIAWVVAVSTDASYRNRGVMTRVLEFQLRQLRDEGFAWAALAAELPVYRKLGFTPTASHVDLAFGSDRSLLSDVVEGPSVQRLNYVASTDELVEFHERFRQANIGEISRDRVWWSRVGRGTHHFCVRSDNGQLEAIASCNITADEDGTTVVTVEDFLATTSASRIALWRHVLRLQCQHLRTSRVPVNDTIFTMLRNPHAATATLHESPWMRVLDVPKALGSRSYRKAVAIKIRVRDELIKENDRTFLLKVDARGRANCEPTDSSPDVSIDVGQLASVIMGHRTFMQLAEVGLAKISDQSAVVAFEDAVSMQAQPFCTLEVV